MTIILDTPEMIEAARLMAIRSGLRLEIKTGMKMNRGRSASVLATEILKGAGVVAQNKRPNKATVYRLLNEWMVSLGFEDKPL